MALRRAVVSLVVIALASASAAQAQRLAGKVRDSITGVPIGGVVVWLADSRDSLLSRSIGNEAGVFSVARPPSAKRLHLVRIGFRPRDVSLGAADSAIDLRLEAIPALLASISASGHRVCPGDRAANEGFELWEQARAALLASVVAREVHPPRIRLIAYERTREPVFNRLKKEESSIKELVVDRSYVAARPAWAFAYEGYMREEQGGDRVYYAPDNETLLDPSFAGTHCLQAARDDRSHPDQIGIAFEPVREGDRDTLVDVRGVLWLDRKSPALKVLEFWYTGLEPEARNSGGEITFRMMPNGAPMIERWTIRTVTLAMDANEHSDGLRRLQPPRELRRNMRRTGMREVGGEVASVYWPDGSKWHGLLPHISGVLVDSAGMPVAGARVWVMKTGDTVTTGADGGFSLPPLLPGLYAVLAADSALAESGLSRTAHNWVFVDREHDADIRLLFHSRAEILQQLCAAQTYHEGTGVVMGRVVNAGGLPIANARIDVWRRIKSNTVELFHQESGGHAGDDGRFIICGTPLDQPLRIRAWGAVASSEVFIEWKDDVFVATLVVRERE